MPTVLVNVEDSVARRWVSDQNTVSSILWRGSQEPTYLYKAPLVLERGLAAESVLPSSPQGGERAGSSLIWKVVQTGEFLPVYSSQLINAKNVVPAALTDAVVRARSSEWGSSFPVSAGLAPLGRQALP